MRINPPKTTTMNVILFKNKFLTIFFFLLISLLSNAQNLLTNGDFESGGVGTGFTLNGTGYNQINAPFVGTTASGDYAFTTNPQPMNVANFITGFDHTTGTGTGKMMVIDGNTFGGNAAFTGGTQRFWKAGNTGGGICGLTVGLTYKFSYWIKSVSTTTTNTATRAFIDIQMNNATNVTLFSGSKTAPLPPTGVATGWVQVVYTFKPTNACVNIELFNTNTNPVGNDFAVDDFAVTAPPLPLSAVYSVVNPSCPNTNNGFISVYGSGGTSPYILYTLNTSPPVSNTTGIFSGLSAGSYSVSVKDTANQTANAINIVLTNPINPLVVSPDASICPGASANLTASAAGATSYTWTANPSDPSLTNPNLQNQIVSPTVTTIYTVVATTSKTQELLFNGDFSGGNIGFTTDYNYFNPANAAAVQSAYGIVTNPNTWEPTFTTCADHTSGTGRMMVVDGSTGNSGNNKVWSQTIPVNANQNYTFSYWVQSLSIGVPANIETLINGVSVGFQLAPILITCGNWTQFTYTWNSGPATTAKIELFDRITAANGNDFAIDDLSFTTTTICGNSKNIKISQLTAAFTNVVIPPIFICPNSTTTISFSGTPLATVSFVSNTGAVSTVVLDAAGIGNFLTPVLTANTTYTLISVANGTCTINLTGSILISISKNGCATVTGADFSTGATPAPICNIGEARTLTANFTPIADTSLYTVSPITFCPNNEPGVTKVIPIVADDAWSPVETLPFDFCFFNNIQTVCQIGTNGLITFNATKPVLVNGTCPYDLQGFPVPSGGFVEKNAIYGVYQDVITNAISPFPNLSINYKIVGVYPCRKLVVNFTDLSQFSCQNSVGAQTSQIILYEISNIIEVHVLRRQPCVGWVNGGGVIGIQNNTGSQGYAPPGRNTGAWSANSEAWRFTPSGPPVQTSYKWFANGSQIPGEITPSLTVSPTATTDYVAQVTYKICNVDKVINSAPVTVEYYGDITAAPTDKCYTAAPVDLTVNETQVLAPVAVADRGDYFFTYFSSLTNAQNGFPIISNPTSYTLPGFNTTIFMVIENNNNSCRNIKSFTYTNCSSPCLTITNPTANQTICQGSNPNAMSVSTSFTGTDAISYVSFSTAQTGVAMYSGGTLIANVTPTGNIATLAANALPTAVGTYYIYAIANPAPGDATCRPFQEIILKINLKADAGVDGQTTVCDRPSATINLSSIITLQQAGGTWTRTSGSGGVFDPVAGTFATALGATSSTFEYTILGLAPCPNDVSIATISINAGVDAGTNGAPISICDNSTTTIDLFAAITGEDAGGTWTRTGSGGIFNPVAGTFTPSAGATTSVFTYSLVGNAPCANSSSSLTVTIFKEPKAGTDGTPRTICENDTTVINLFAAITGEQAGGTWTRTGTGGNFDPIAGTFTSAVGATTSIFTYTVIGTAPCITDTSELVVTINQEAKAGADGSTTICDNNTNPIDLNLLITGQQAGGSWIRTSGVGGNFAAATGIYTPAVNATSSTFTYTKTAILPCTTDTSLATVNINHQPNAGVDGTTSVCGNIFTPINLNNIITGQESGGVWTRTSGTGGTFVAATGIYIPAANATSSTFDYSFSGTLPCVNDKSTVTVNLNPIPTASISTSSPSVCRNFASPIITFTGIGGTAPYTFNYTLNNVPFTITTTTGNSVTTTINTSITGPYTFVVTNVQDANCTNPQNETIVINVLDAPIVNTPTPYIICDDNATFDGVGAFDLHTKDNSIKTAANQVVGYYYTQTDANIGLNNGSFPEITANPFINNAPGTVTPVQIIWVKVIDPFAPQCYTVVQMQLIVKPRPLQNLTLTPLQICDVTAPAILEPFDLHTKDADIINGQTGVVVNYFATQALAETNNPANALPNQNAYIIPTIPDSATQTIWYNASFTSNGCGTVGPLDLIVNPLPNATQPAYAAYQVCETPDRGVTGGLETFNLNSKISDISLGQTNVNVTFYLTYNDAVANTGVISNANANAFQNTVAYSQTIGIRVTNPTTGCYRVSSIDLIVNPLPLPVPPTTLATTICDDDTPNGNATFDLSTLTPNIIGSATGVTVTYHLTLTDAENNQNAVPNIFNNSNPFLQTLWVRETVIATGCFKIIAITITVNPAPIVPLAPALPDLNICDEDANNQSASTNVNLTVQSPLLLNLQSQPNNFTIRYFDNLAAASSTIAGASIFYPQSYFATNNQTIWVRIENNITKCFQVVSFNIIINIPLLITTPAPLEVCDDGVLPITNPLKTAFNLTQRNVLVLNGASPTDYTVDYYTSQAGSLAGTGLILNPTSYTNVTNPQTLGVIVTSKDGCRSYTTLTINVLPLPTPNTNPPALADQCDDNIVNAPNNPTGFEYFNLTTNANFIKNSDPNVTLRYFPTKADAEAEPPTNEIKLPTNDPANALVAGDVYIRVESNLYINSEGVKCYTLVIQKLKVNPLPTVSLLDANINPGNQVQICQNIAVVPPVVATFNLTGLIPELLINNPTVVPPTTPPTYTNTYTTTFYTTAADAKTGTNAITTPNAYVSTATIGTPQTIYVRVVNNQTGCVNPFGNFTIVVNPKPTVTAPPAFLTCDTDGKNDGFFDYPLDILIPNILGTQSSTDYTVTFYNNYNDALLSQNAIANQVNYQTYTHDLWIRVENNITKCFELDKVKQMVELIPEPTIFTANGDKTICVDFINDRVIKPITLLVSNPIPDQGPTVNTYEWFEEKPAGTFTSVGTGLSYVVNTSAPLGATRYYTVRVKSSSASPLGCAVTSSTFEVIQSGPAVDQQGTTGYFVTNAFEDSQIVTVTTTGYGTYQYSIDGGVFQDSPVFENVSVFGEFGATSHYITVRDIKGGDKFSCDDYKIIDVQTIDFPHYFTPNGDGINDTWNINGLKNQAAVIYIFNREGKLVKQLAPNGNGWDGNFNGAQLPSSDYWFTVDFTESTIQKQFKSHFSLKR